MRHRLPGRQSGFTLAELGVAIALLAILSAALYPVIGPQMSWKSRVDTDRRMNLLRDAIETAYRQNIVAIDGDAAARLNLGAVGIIDPTAMDANRYCTPVVGALDPIAPVLKSAPADAMRDGYGLSFCVFVEARRTITYNGQDITYHPIAIVSGGPNGQIAAGTTLAGGQLTVASDDLGIVVDAAGVAIRAYTRTMEVLSRASGAMQQYFVARYNADPARAPSIDYFGCGAAACPPGAAAGGWDGANDIPTTCAGPVNMTTTAAGVIGLSREDVTDGYGQVVQYDNCGAGLRSPGNATANMQLPPFTAAAQTTMPNGALLMQTAVGMVF